MNFNKNIFYKDVAILSCDCNNYLTELNYYNNLTDTCDFYLITNADIKNEKLKIIGSNYLSESIELDSYYKEKFYKSKIFDLDFLNTYNIVIFIEANFLKINNLENEIKKSIDTMKKNKNIFLLSLKSKYRTFKEHYDYAKYEIINNEKLKTQIEQYSLNLKRDKIVLNTEYLVIQKNKFTKKIFDAWWTEIKTHTINDDISLNYLLNLNKLNNIAIIKKSYLSFEPYKLKDLNEKINGIDGIVWINLERSLDRREKMEKLLENINVPNERINAIDGKIYDFSYLFDKIKMKSGLSNYEVACTLSHIKAINKLKNKEGKYFMICEDDINFNNAHYFNHDLKKIIDESPHFDILSICKIYHHTLPKLYNIWEKKIMGTGCYLITKEAVNKICVMAEYNETNDTFNFNTNEMFTVADVFIYKLVNTIAYKYNYVCINNIDSTIHTNHIHSHILSSKNQKMIILNDFFKNII